MRRRSILREPNARDLSRLALARASSKVSLARARDAFVMARVKTLRAEIAATVRFVSPFLLALLEGTSITVADLVGDILPAAGWPDQLLIPAHRSFSGADRPAASGAVPAWVSETWAYHAADPPLHGADVILPDGVHLHVRVVDHSIEAAGRVGGLWFVSLFGTLSVGVPPPLVMRAFPIPGRRLEDVVDLPERLRRGWIVHHCAPGDDRWVATLGVRTGVARCRFI